MSDRGGGYLVILTRHRDMCPSHQDSHQQPLSSHEYQNVSHMDISSLTMAWTCKIAQLHCPAVSMRFEVSRLFSRAHNRSSNKVVSPLWLSLFALVACLLRAQTHCSLLLLPPPLYLLGSLYRAGHLLFFSSVLKPKFYRIIFI